MTNRSARTFGINVGVAACIAIAGVVGTTLPAHAAAAPAIASQSSIVDRSGSRSTPTPSAPGGAAAASAPVGSASAESETRSWATIIRTAINALKKIPVLWKKVVDGAKRSLAWFRSNVWPSIKATVNLVSALLTAQEIWKFFN